MRLEMQLKHYRQFSTELLLRWIADKRNLVLNSNSKNMENELKEKPDSWWYRVYGGVILTLIVVISLLIAFSKYFS